MAEFGEIVRILGDLLQAVEGTVPRFDFRDLVPNTLVVERLEQEVGAIVLCTGVGLASRLPLCLIESRPGYVERKAFEFLVRIGRLLLAGPVETGEPSPSRVFGSLGHLTGPPFSP